MSQVLTRCGVPIFFLISSVLLFKSRRNYWNTIRAKVNTLLIPYFFWNTFWIIVFILLQRLSFPSPHNYPLWFIRDLMIVTLAFPIIGRVANKFPKLLLTGAIILLLLPYTFPVKEALLWFCIGACIVELQLHMTIVDRLSIVKFSVFYMLCAIATLIIQYEIIDRLFIFIGILYWIRVSKCIVIKNRLNILFALLSRWTFMIYVTHELTLTCLKKVCFRLLPTEPIWLLIEYVLLPIVVIVGCSVVGAIFKRVMPKLYSILTGSR